MPQLPRINRNELLRNRIESGATFSIEKHTNFRGGQVREIERERETAPKGLRETVTCF